MPTSITLEFTSDGNCSIAVRGGASSRAEMSYRPQVPGRCAIPAVREAGPVTLTVLLPPGMPPPRSSEPVLNWRDRGGRSVGTAELAAAPEYVDVMPPREGAAGLYTWGAIALGVVALIWLVRGRRGPRRPGPAEMPAGGRSPSS